MQNIKPVVGDIVRVNRKNYIVVDIVSDSEMHDIYRCLRAKTEDPSKPAYKPTILSAFFVRKNIITENMLFRKSYIQMMKAAHGKIPEKLSVSYKSWNEFSDKDDVNIIGTLDDNKEYHEILRLYRFFSNRIVLKVDEILGKSRYYLTFGPLRKARKKSKKIENRLQKIANNSEKTNKKNILQNPYSKYLMDYLPDISSTKEQKELFKEIRPGDIVYCMMPESLKNPESIPEGHRTRPYFIVNVLNNSLIGFYMSSSEFYDKTNYGSFYRIRSGRNLGKDRLSYIDFRRPAILYPGHLIRLQCHADRNELPHLRASMVSYNINAAILFNHEEKTYKDIKPGNILVYANNLYYVYQKHDSFVEYYKVVFSSSSAKLQEFPQRTVHLKFRGYLLNVSEVYQITKKALETHEWTIIDWADPKYTEYALVASNCKKVDGAKNAISTLTGAKNATFEGIDGDLRGLILQLNDRLWYIDTPVNGSSLEYTGKYRCYALETRCATDSLLLSNPDTSPAYLNLKKKAKNYSEEYLKLGRIVGVLRGFDMKRIERKKKELSKKGYKFE